MEQAEVREINDLIRFRNCVVLHLKLAMALKLMRERHFEGTSMFMTFQSCI